MVINNLGRIKMSLTEIPSQFATYFDINVTTAQLIISLAVIMFLLLPTMILARGKNAPMIWLIMVFFGEAITLGLGWSPFWVMIMLMALTAAGIAFLGSKAVTGG